MEELLRIQHLIEDHVGVPLVLHGKGGPGRDDNQARDRDLEIFAHKRRRVRVAGEPCRP